MISVWIAFIVATTLYWTIKNKYGEFLALFFWYPILPNAFGIRLGDLPLLSANRIILVFVIAVYIYRRKWKVNFLFNKVNRIQGFSFLAASLMLVLIINAMRGCAGLNDFISYAIEFFLIIVLLYTVFQSVEMTESAIKYISYAAMLMYVLGCLEFALGTSLGNTLYTGYSSIELAQRLGVRRAGVTMNAITYGYYCVFTFPIIHYMFEKTKKTIYAVAMLLCAFATACSITRSAIIVLFLEVIGFFVIEKKKLDRKKLNSVILLAIACVGAFIFAALLNSEVYSQMIRIAEATVNTFNTAAKYSSLEINNANVLSSRFYQYTVAIWLIKTGHLLTGYGPDAITTDRLFYLTMEGNWWHLRIGDTAYAVMLGTGGLLTLISYMVFYLNLAKRSLRMSRNDAYRSVFIMISALLLVCNLLSVFYRDNLVIIYYALILAGTRRHTKNRSYESIY